MNFITVLVICLKFYVFHVASGQHCRRIPITDKRWMAAKQSCNEPMWVTADTVYLQKNTTHCLPCPIRPNGDKASRVLWQQQYQGHEVDIARYESDRGQGTNCSSTGYGMSSKYELVIDSAKSTDRTKFMCRLVDVGSRLPDIEQITVVDVLDLKQAMYLTRNEVFLQRHLSHNIRCPVPQGNQYYAMEWSKEVMHEGESFRWPVAHYSSPGYGTSYTSNNHYGLVASSHDLIIQNTALGDGGDYHCQVSPSGWEFRLAVCVLDTRFPVFPDAPRLSNESLVLQRGQMHIIICPITTAFGISNDTVYWTLDVGKENYTSVIGAVFSDGETLVTDAYQGRYNINEERNLVVNSLEGAENRYWCNVFKMDHGLSTGYINVTGKVTSQQEFPYISGCDKSEVECSIEVDQITSLNCSVANLYPIANLSWSLSKCEAGDRPPFLSKAYLVSDPGSETFNQSQELSISGNTTFRCTFTCEASGLSIAYSSIAKSVNVTWKEHNVIEQGNPLGIALAIALPLLVLVVVVILIIFVCKKKRTRTENRGIQMVENGVARFIEDDRDDNANDGAER